MKNINAKGLLIQCLIFFFLIGCAPSLKVTGSWINKEKAGTKKYHKLFIIALAEKFEVKTQLEMNIALAAADRGFSVVKSSDIFPYTFSKDNIPNKEVLLEKIRKAECDAIFTVVPLKKESETRYVESSVGYTPMMYDYYGNFYHYYNYYTPIVYSEGYYTTDHLYFLESNLYDLESGDLLWSIQSEATNPANLDAFCKDYTAMLVREVGKTALKQK